MSWSDFSVTGSWTRPADVYHTAAPGLRAASSGNSAFKTISVVANAKKVAIGTWYKMAAAPITYDATATFVIKKASNAYNLTLTLYRSVGSANVSVQVSATGSGTMSGAYVYTGVDTGWHKYVAYAYQTSVGNLIVDIYIDDVFVYSVTGVPTSLDIAQFDTVGISSTINATNYANYTIDDLLYGLETA